MLAERVAERAENVLPTLIPVMAADQGHAEKIIRSARSEIARLALELRVLRRDVAVADAADRLPDGADLPAAAAELLAIALEQRVTTRRSELAADLERSRAEAARLVAAAQAEAVAVVAASRAEMLAVLLDRSAPRPLDPPALRVVRDTLPAPKPPATSHLAEADAGVSRRAELTGEAPPPARLAWSQQPVPPPVPTAPGLMSPPASPPAAPLIAEPEPAPQGPPTVCYTAADDTSRPASHGSFCARYLYVDVVLPLLAVLIVVVVLLAWVG